MSLASVIVEEGLENIGRFYSVYRGIVADNEDPKNRGRLSVIVPQVSGRAIWAVPKGIDGAMGSGFKWVTPKKGQIVWVEYQTGDPGLPVWSYHAWANNEIPPELVPTNNLGLVTPFDNKVILEDKEGHLYIHIVDPKSIEENKVVTTIDISKGEVSIKSKTKVNIESEVITLNGEEEGVPISSKVVQKLNRLEEDLNTFKGALTTWLGAGPIDVKLSAAILAATWNTDILVPTNISEIESYKVKQ